MTTVSNNLSALLESPSELRRSAPKEFGSRRTTGKSEVVSLRNVEKSYERGGAATKVLSSCSLTIESGQCVFLTGPSGSGKSTLLSIVGCVLSADRGEVRVLGRDISLLSQRMMAEMRLASIGFVFQRFHLMRGLTALENVCLPLLLAGVARATAHRHGRELLALVGLADQTSSDPRRLSVGQCQRVAIARALAADPPLLLADEPTASLDADHGQRVMQLLRDLTVDRGKSAIIVTHDPRIEAYADRILSVDKGRVVEQRSAHCH